MGFLLLDIVEPMRNYVRPIAIFSLILGVALLTLGWLLPKAITPERPVPLELAATTLTLEDENATVGQAYPASGGKTEQAPVQKQFNITLSQPADEETAAAKVGVSTSRTDVDDEAEGLMTAEIWNFMVDRMTGEVTGEAKVADTPATPATTVPNISTWAKFPQDVEQRDYDYFDDQLRAPVPATFKGTINKPDAAGEDHELYIFEQVIPDSKVAEHYDSIWNTTTVERDGEQVEGDLIYSGTRTLTVEPRSGLIVALEESLDSRYEDAEGNRLDDLLVFNGKTTDKVERDMLHQALKLGEFRHSNTWGLVLTGVGAIVTAASLIALVVWRRKP